MDVILRRGYARMYLFSHGAALRLCLMDISEKSIATTYFSRGLDSLFKENDVTEYSVADIKTELNVEKRIHVL